MPSSPAPLPPAVHDAAVERLLSAPTERWPDLLVELQQEHPQHTEGLRDLVQVLAHAESVLGQSFPGSRDGDVPTFDGYRVQQRLGEGAFGVVYLCEQLEPIPRQVAIKVLRPGAGDRATLARFEAERRFLARLHHPCIAQIFDAGLLADGRPWFGMEYVPGVPFAAYCDRHRLSIADRLQLFVRLCLGVQHAHEQGIVHRDLKPANVLVVEVDGQPQPKIIDFGVARALQRPAGEGTPQTEAGRVVGTPGYMSPEQQHGQLTAVDARSDVFGLGAMLYELLTGELPWGERPTSTDSEPPRPSQRVATSRNRTANVAERRGDEPRRLASRLRGDLDWIVLRALERQPARRYQSARDLAADVERHLRREPIAAGPPSLAYRVRKFVQRRRGTVLAALCLLVVAAVGFGVGAHYRASAKASERRRIEDALAAVTQLLERSQDRALATAPQRLSMQRELLRDGLQLYERTMHDQVAEPEHRRLRLRCLVGLTQVHTVLAEPTAGRPILDTLVAEARALAALDPSSAKDAAVLAWSLYWSGRCASDLGDYRAADLALRESAERYRDLMAKERGRHSVDLATVRTEHAEVARLLGDDAAVGVHLHEAVALLAPHVASHQDDTRAADRLLVAQADRFAWLHNGGDVAGAERAMQEAMPLVVTPGRVSPTARAWFQTLRARWHEWNGELPAALATLAEATSTFETDLQTNPEAHGIRRQLAYAYQQLVRIRCGQRDTAAALAAGASAATVLAGMPPSVHRRTEDSITILCSISLRVVELATPEAIRAATEWTTHAMALADGMPDDAPRAAHLRLQARMSLGQQRFLRQDFGDIAAWRDLVERAMAVGDVWHEAYARHVLTQWHRTRQELDEARRWSQTAVALVAPLPPGPNDDSLRQSILRTAMSIEWQAGRHEAQAAIARSIAEAADWRLVHAAANAFYRSWLLVDEGSADRERYARDCVGACEHILALAEAARNRPDYGSLRALGVAQQAVRLGMVAADHPRARELRRDGLATLARLRGKVQPSWWDREVWVRGNVAAALDHQRAGELDAALAHLRQAVGDDGTAFEALALADAFAACHRLAATTGAGDAAKECERSATDLLRRAVAGGVELAHVQALAEQRTLATFGDYAAIVAELPK